MGSDYLDRARPLSGQKVSFGGREVDVSALFVVSTMTFDSQESQVHPVKKMTSAVTLALMETPLARQTSNNYDK